MISWVFNSHISQTIPKFCFEFTEDTLIGWACWILNEYERWTMRRQTIVFGGWASRDYFVQKLRRGGIQGVKCSSSSPPPPLKQPHSHFVMCVEGALGPPSPFRAMPLHPQNFKMPGCDIYCLGNWLEPQSEDLQQGRTFSGKVTGHRTLLSDETTWVCSFRLFFVSFQFPNILFMGQS